MFYITFNYILKSYLRPDRDDYVTIVDDNVSYEAEDAMKIREKKYGETFDVSVWYIYFISFLLGILISLFKVKRLCLPSQTP